MQKNNQPVSQEKFKTLIGGQALIEGILMQGPDKRAIVVRGPEGLVQKVEPIKKKTGILTWPLIRGVVNFGSSMVNGVIRKTSEALEENNMKQAHRIQEGDVVINRFERHIEQTCLSLIKRESPIASDLRLITAALKIITDLERAADQCADICEIIERIDARLKQEHPHSKLFIVKDLSLIHI